MDVEVIGRALLYGSFLPAKKLRLEFGPCSLTFGSCSS